MRRTLLAVSAMTLAAVALPTSASAANTTVVSRNFIPDSLQVGSADCATQDAVPFNVDHETGPGSPPAGVGSLRLGAPVSSTLQLSAPDVFGSPGSLTAFALSTYVPSGSNAVTAAFIAMDSDASDSYDALAALPPATAVWTTTDLLTATLTWATVNSTTGQITPFGSGTYSQYRTAHPSHNLLGVSLRMDNCSQSQANFLNLDALVIGFAGTTTTYDFEPSLPASLTNSLSPAKSVAGGPVTVKATLRSGGEPVAGAAARLFARRAGSAGFTEIPGATTNASGVAKSVQHPKVTTTYRWEFNGNNDVVPKRSAGRTVSVATKITLNVVDKTLKRGQDLSVSGKTTPVRAGATVKVWEHHGSTTTKLGSATVNSHGLWHLVRHLHQGTHTVYATTAATSTNTSGRSRSVKVSAA
jgi:hypothetical protein